MINKKSIDAITLAKFSNEFIMPLYDSYCFSNIPQAIKNILLHENKPSLPNDVFGDLLQSNNNVLLFLIDGFGWNFFEKYKDTSPFLQRLIRKGIVSKLTAQYPTTTANQITTIHTGLKVGQHGNYEWFHYDPELDAIIAPLLFSFAGKKIRNTLTHTGIDSTKIYPQTTLYSQLIKSKIKSFVYLDKEFAFSPYSKSVIRGAEVISYTTIPEALTNLIRKIKCNKSGTYYFFYFNKIDTIAHKYGPDSPQCDAEITMLLDTLENVFYRNIKGAAKKTILLMTSDHGQVKVVPEETVYLNLQYPEIKNWIQVNKKGELLAPAGTCRDMFLHIREQYLDRAQKFLQNKLNNKTEIYKVKDLIAYGFFGTEKPSKFFLDRVGNLVVLCKGNHTVWWYEKDRFEQIYKGHHGSLTRQEMEIPFACFTLD